MKVKKQITGYGENAIEVTDISILSADEYKTAEKNIPLVDGWWWLRSPGICSWYATCVRPGGGVSAHGLGVYNVYVGVRPALRINPKSLNLQIGDKMQFDSRIWTYIAEGILLCDEIICDMPFRNDWRADDANHYEASDVKAYLTKRFCKVLRVPRSRDSIAHTRDNYYVMEEHILYDVYVDAKSIVVFPSTEAAKEFMQKSYPDWEPRHFDGAEGCNLVLLWENKKDKHCNRAFVLREVPANPEEVRWPKA